MGYSVPDKSRIGRSAYWTQFIVNIGVIIALLVGMVMAAMGGNLGVALLCFLLVAPVGIYFRVVMMRRCRDIGWPAFLPWVLFGAGILANVFRASQGLDGLRNPGGGGLPMLIGLADFAFMIVIGCIQGRGHEDYASHFAPDDDYSPAAPARFAGTPAPIPAMPRQFGEAPLDREQEEAGWDAAIARALEARQRAEGQAQTAAPAPRMSAPGLQRPAGGFGRRVI